MACPRASNSIGPKSLSSVLTVTPRPADALGEGDGSAIGAGGGEDDEDGVAGVRAVDDGAASAAHPPTATPAPRTAAHRDRPLPSTPASRRRSRGPHSACSTPPVGG